MYRILLQLPFFIILFLISVAYFIFYYNVAQLGYENSFDVLAKIVNLHDHNVYVEKIQSISSGGVKYEANNDFGIALIYLITYVYTGFNNLVDIYLFSFLFNINLLFLAFIFYNKICNIENLNNITCLFFFTNISLVYFSQLINKDLITYLVLLIALYSGVKKNYFLLVIILPIAFLIRQQLALCIITFVFLMLCRNTKFWIVISYVFSSLVAGYISVHMNIISDESLGSGISSFIVKFNREYYAGYLFFNPIRLLQYFYSIPQSFFNIYVDGEVDMAAIFRFMMLPFVFLSMSFIFKSIFQFQVTRLTSIKPFFILTYSFFICWLMNPTINGRYIILILPIMVLGYFIQRKYFIKRV
ncbi:hypothetical protein ACMAZD_01120 [Vibrio sp. nBUS_14]|uniref:hypothetical protein n=1 Tax=Vibrio sp. nBUS_14 TaxID=3395321 RepID=UPI003EC060F3